MSLLIVGSIALDSVRTPFGAVTDALGGSASFASLAASFFTPVNLVGVVGADFPQEHLDFLRSRDVDLQGLQTRAGQTFRWGGYYEYDMNQAHTDFTCLNVFADFRPHLPPAYRATPYVFLANIDPVLQRSVLEQVARPRLVICDTMNFWITNHREELIKTLQRVDIVLLNDSEARQLCGTPSLLQAARKVLSWGPHSVIIKKGEHGALLVRQDDFFAIPGYPLEEVCDPTGAGDSFAGGFIGYMASTDDLSAQNLRRAMVVGSALASFAVEDFSLERLRLLTFSDIARRCQAFRSIVDFDGLGDLPQRRSLANTLATG